MHKEDRLTMILLHFNKKSYIIIIKVPVCKIWGNRNDNLKTIVIIKCEDGENII